MIYRIQPAGFGWNWCESAHIGVNQKKKKKKKGESAHWRSVAASPVRVRHPFCPVGASGFYSCKIELVSCAEPFFSFWFPWSFFFVSWKISDLSET